MEQLIIYELHVIWKFVITLLYVGLNWSVRLLQKDLEPPILQTCFITHC